MTLALRKFRLKPFSAQDLPYKERIFNYTLLHAQRVVENTFGLLAHRWRCLLSCLYLEPMKAINIVEGSLTLHNLICIHYLHLQANEVDHEDEQGNLVPGVPMSSSQTRMLEEPGIQLYRKGAEELFDGLLQQ